MKDNTSPLLEEVIANILKIPESQVVDTTAPQNTPEWDSFNSMVLIAEIEKVYNIELQMDELPGMTSVGAIKNILRNKNISL